MKATQKLGATVIAGAALLFSTSTGLAQTTCLKQAGGGACSSVTTLTEHTPPPDIFCLIGSKKVRIESTAQCLGIPAGPAVTLRCGVLSDPFVYSGGGITHVLAPATGANWQSVLNGNCGLLEYAAFATP